mgnify:CR=1 FL=1
MTRMKNVSAEIRAGAVATVLCAVVLLTASSWYGSTEVGFKVEGDTLYRKIKNGMTGAHCYDENGKKVIAPSRWFGQKWIPIASANAGTATQHLIACYPYHSLDTRSSDAVVARYPE